MINSPKNAITSKVKLNNTITNHLTPFERNLMSPRELSIPYLGELFHHKFLTVPPLWKGHCGWCDSIVEPKDLFVPL